MRFLPPKTHTTHTKKPRRMAGLLGVFLVGRDDPARLDRLLPESHPASRANSGAAMTVSRPVTTIASELAAPCISPISTAREVPAA